MRLAITGTHSMGKTTLLGDCAGAFPDFQCETEAYRSLRSFNPNLQIGRERVDSHFKRLDTELDLQIPVVEIQGTRQEWIAAIGKYIGLEPAVLPA